MRVLGVDPGLTRCGISVVDGAMGRRCSLVHVEVAGSSPQGDLGQRLLTVEHAIVAAIATYEPEVIAVERVFSQHNVRTVMGTAQASAIAAVSAARAGLPVALHTPSEVKAAVTGNGRADKAQVGTMIARILSLKELPRPADAADAIAIAICHLWRSPAQQRMNAALAQVNAGRAHTLARVATVEGQER